MEKEKRSRERKMWKNWCLHTHKTNEQRTKIENCTNECEKC